MDTSVSQWLRNYLQPKLTPEQRASCDILFSQADELFKKQIMDAWYDGASSDPLPTIKNAEKYYEHKFKK